MREVVTTMLQHNAEACNYVVNEIQDNELYSEIMDKVEEVNIILNTILFLEDAHSSRSNQYNVDFSDPLSTIPMSLLLHDANEIKQDIEALIDFHISGEYDD